MIIIQKQFGQVQDYFTKTIWTCSKNNGLLPLFGPETGLLIIIQKQVGPETGYRIIIQNQSGHATGIGLLYQKTLDIQQVEDY